MNNENDITRQYSDEEIWNMLKPKMEKNGFKPIGKIYETNANGNYCSDFIYKAVDAHKAIAYLRSKKERPFILGGKNKQDASF